MRPPLLLALVLAVAPAGVRALDHVTVIRLELPFDEQHSVVVNTSVEYIIGFTQAQEPSSWAPAVVWVSSAEARATSPVLVTARQNTDALTWQLPWSTSAGTLVHELQRTLCPRNASSVAGQDPQCVEEGESPWRVWLHISSTCAASTEVSFRLRAARDWRLAFGASTDAVVSQAAPAVHYYAFEDLQENVRLVVSSDDDVCAIVSVQNVHCPIPQTAEEVDRAGLRMTVQRSGGAQLSRSVYPSGFYVIAMRTASNAVCTGELEPGEDWLWDDMLWGGGEEGAAPALTKRLVFSIEPSLTRAQYAVATSVTLVFLGAFYLLFGVAVLAQRFEIFRKYVEPVAPPDLEQTQSVEVDGGDRPAASALRRRGSTATFDSSDMSDTDSEAEAEAGATVSRQGTRTTRASSLGLSNHSESGARHAQHSPPNERQNVAQDGQSLPQSANQNARQDGQNVPENAQSVPQDSQNVEQNGQQNAMQSEADSPEAGAAGAAGAAGTAGTPFGLPTQLRLAALARRHQRVLRARSNRYLWILITVATFYALPVMQFVAAFQIMLNVSGSLDMCYYNFLCAHPAGQVSDFNHVFSNLGYLLLGVLFVLQVNRRRLRRKKTPLNEAYGIPAHYGLLYSLGVAMMVVALLSATYHICPNRLNFQFDTAFMYVMAVISMVKIYQSRHPDVNARAHATFGVLAVIIALGVWGVLGGGALFWGLFTVLHIFTFLMLSLNIYYVGQFRFEKDRIQTAAREIASIPKSRPLYRARLIMLLLANCANWLLALYGLWSQTSDFASHLLQVLLGNLLLYLVFYLTMKLLHGERPRWYAWLFLAGAAAAWAPALYFFTYGSTDWSTTPAQSRARNHRCKLLQFYDSHDLWHLLSAVALYLTFCAMLTWDDGLAAVKRTEIAVF